VDGDHAAAHSAARAAPAGKGRASVRAGGQGDHAAADEAGATGAAAGDAAGAARDRAGSGAVGGDSQLVRWQAEGGGDSLGAVERNDAAAAAAARPAPAAEGRA